MVELTFKGEKVDVTLKGENIAQIKEEYLKIKDDLEKEFGKTAVDLKPEKKIVHEPKPTGKESKETVADKILALKEEGFFDKPKTLIEIRKRLEEVGFYYPVTSFPPYLLKICEDRKLRRYKEKRGKKNIWIYVKT